MSLTDYLLIIVIAAVVAWITARYLPRARSSPFFDRLMTIGSFVIAVLLAWVAVQYTDVLSAWPVLTNVMVGTVPLVAVILAAVLGALMLNLPLWFMDLITPPEEPDMGEETMPEDQPGEEMMQEQPAKGTEARH